MSKLNNTIGEVLNSFEGIERAKARPFMHTRVMARLEVDEKNIWSSVAGFIARPVVAISCLVLVIIGNYLIINNNGDSIKTTAAVSSPNSAADLLTPDNYILAVNNYEPTQRP